MIDQDTDTGAIEKDKICLTADRIRQNEQRLILRVMPMKDDDTQPS